MRNRTEHIVIICIEGLQMIKKIKALNRAVKESRRDGNSYKAVMSLGSRDESPGC